MDEKTLLSRLRSEEDYERELLSRLQYVEDIPTVGGFAREAGKAVALGGASAVASSLRGSSAASAAIEKIRDTRLREQVQFQLDRATSAVRPEDPTMAAREIRRLANLYMEKDERDELTALANEIEKGPEEREEAKKAIEETKPFTGPYKPLSERLPYRAGEALQKKADTELERRKGYEEGKIGFGLDVAQGAGSIAGIVGASVLGGYPGVIAASSFMGIDEQFQRAKKAGLKEDEAVDYALAGAGPGAIGTLSAEFMLRKIPVPIRSKMLKIAGEVAGAGAGEAMVEALQQTWQNALEMRYNKDRGLFDGTIYAGAVGGAAGLALKPIFMALIRGKGASVSGPQEPDVEAHEAERIRREFAMEEVRLRAEEVRAKGAAGSDSGEVGEAPGTQEAVVREAARGKIKEAGEPVTLTLKDTGDIIKGTRKSDQPNELGQYEFYDQDGTKLIYEADEFDVKKGWLNEKTDAELEQDLERWLKAESPWQKVTVTTPEGEVIKGVASGELNGKHFVRGPDGELLPQGTGEISPGWDASTTTKPPTFTGERAKTKAAVTPLTESDKGSPIPNALIQEGKGVLADAQGVEAANKVLEALGLPAVDTEVGYRKPDGSVVRATIQDAAGDKFSILTEEGELKVGSAETLTRRIVPLPEEGETDVQEAGAQGEQVRQQDQGLQEGRRDGSGRPQADQDSQGRTQPSLEGQVVSPAAREPVAETAATPQAPEPQAVTTPLAGEVESAPPDGAAPPPADVPEQRRQEDQPPPLEQEPVTREWWDSATPEQRRAAVVTAGFSEQITPTRARPSRQGDSYVSSEWDSLPAAARTSIATASRPAIRTYAQSRAQQALSDTNVPVSDTSVSLSATPARTPVARIATRDIPDGGATARTASGARVPVRYAVVEASSLAASLMPDGRINPSYPAELQPRDRSSAPSKDQIEYIANNLDPEQLERSPKASDGAPIISPDGVVESGNGRVTALRRAYERGAAEDYRNYLRDKGYPVADMKEPVLVRVRENEFTPDERISFVKDANEPDVLAMSATEQAIADGKAIPDSMLDLYRGGYIGSPSNRPFVRAFISKFVPRAAQGRMISADGELSQDAIRRVEGALFSKAYGDPELLKALIESPDVEIKAIGGALKEVAAQWSKMRGMAADGRIDPAMDQTAALMEAVKIVRRARIEDRSVAEFVGQIDIFSGETISPITEGFLRLMFRNTADWTQPMGQARLKAALLDYTQQAEKTKPGVDLTGDAGKQPEQILNEARTKQAPPKEGPGLFDATTGARPEPKPEAKTEAAVAKEPTRRAEPSNAKPSTRGKQLKKPAAKAGGRGKDDETGAKQVAKATKKSAKTQPKPAAPAPTFKQEGLIYRKNGQPFASEQSAMMTHSRETHEAVQVDGGWAVRRKDSVIKAQRPQEARTTKTSAQEKATQQIRDYLDKVGLGDVLGMAQPQVRLPDGTWVAGAYLSKEQAARIDGIRQAIVKVSLEDSPDYAATVRHEVIHALRDMNLFYDGEWSALESAAKADKALMTRIKGTPGYGKLSEEAQVEEAIADMFAAHASGANKQKGFIGRLLDKIRDFFKGLGDTFRSADLKTAKQVFAAIEKGEIGNRPRVPTKAEVLRSEAFAKKALAELDDPGGGIIKASMIARWRGSDFDFAKDVGTTRKVVASPRQNASLSPHSAPWYVTQKQQQAMRDTIAAQLGREYEPYQKLKATNRLNVDKVLELGMMEDRVYAPSQAGTITVTAGTDTGLMKAGESLTLTQEETEAYQSVRKMLGKALDLYRASVVMRFGFDPNTVRTARDAMGLITPATSKADEAKIKLLAKMLTDLKQSERTGYTPLSRFGNIVVVAKGKDPKTGRDTVLHSETIEVTGVTGWIKQKIIGAPEIERLKAQLEAKYPGATVDAFQVAAKNDPRPMHERDVLVELLNVPPQDLEAKLKELEKSSLERGFRRHFFRAKKIPGYSLDFERSIADYVMNLSGNVARSAYHKQWKDAINAIPKNKPYEIQYAEKYYEYANNPQEEFSTIRQIGFVSFLASNVSNAFFNGLQVPFVSIPYMSMFSPVAKVGVEVARASKDVGLMFSKRRGFDFFDPNKAPLDVRADLKRAWDAGEFVSLGVFDMVGVANTGSRLKRQLGFKTRKIVEYMAIPQTLIERTNRVSTYIAAHRIARKGGAAFEAKVRQILEKNALAQETVLKDYSPDAFARFMVDETHFDMGKINRPHFMRSYGAPLFQFQSYTVNYIETLYKTASMYGAPGKKAFGMMVAGLLMSSGMFAFPFADDAMFLAELLHKWWTGLDKDIRSDIREAVYELTGSPALGAAVTNGVFHTIGIDATNRVGLGKILPRSPEEAGGVPLSLLTGSVWGTATSIKEGRWGEALIGPLPLALKNAATAAMWNYTGVRTQYGDVVIPPDQVTPGQVALKAFGFTPSSVSDQRAMEWSQQRASKATQDLRTKYYSRMAKTIAAMNRASEEGDAEGAIKYERKLDEIIDELGEHNEWAQKEEKYHLIVKLDRNTLKKRVAAEYVGRGVIRDKEAPKLSRARRQELREIYGADAE